MDRCLRNISKSLSVEMSFKVTVPCLGVAIVSNLYIYLVQTRWQHRETTGDVCCRPLNNHTLLPSYEHHAVIVSAS